MVGLRLWWRDEVGGGKVVERFCSSYLSGEALTSLGDASELRVLTPAVASPRKSAGVASRGSPDNLRIAESSQVSQSHDRGEAYKRQLEGLTERAANGLLFCFDNPQSPTPIFVLLKLYHVPFPSLLFP